MWPSIVTKSKLIMLVTKQAGKSEMYCLARNSDFIQKPSRPTRWWTRIPKATFPKLAFRFLRFAGAAMKRYPMPKVRETQVRW